MLKHNVKQFSADKILNHIDRIHDWLLGKNPPPITVELDMTNKCNNACKHCTAYLYPAKNNDMMSNQLAAKIIKDLSAANVRALIFTGGGEPLCHDFTPQAMKLSKNQGMDTALITNGLLLTEKIANTVLDNCEWLRISLDAGTPAMYKLTHGMGKETFIEVLNNIKQAVLQKRNTKSRCTIGIGFLTNNQARKDMLKATILAKNLGVDYIQFRPTQKQVAGRLTYDNQSIDKEIEKCMKHASSSFDVLYSQHKYEMMKRKDYGRIYDECLGQQFTTTICANGKMYLCCHTRYMDRYCLGDLSKDPFLKIWDSHKRQKAIGNINLKHCMPLCRDNTFNQILYSIKHPKQHKNFL